MAYNKTAQAKYQRSHPEAVAYKQARKYKRQKDLERHKRLSRKFGIDLLDYLSILEAQGGVCAVCSKPPIHRQLDVDHCHQTGAIRGLLCSACNTAIGLMGDNTDRLRWAAVYLEDSRK